MNKKRQGFIFGILTGAAWGTYGIFSTLLLDLGITEETLVALAGVVLFLYFGIVALIFKRDAFKKTSLKLWVIVLIFGALAGTAFNYVYMMAYGSGMPAGIVAAVSFAYVPIMMIESYFIWKYKFSTQKVIAMVVSLVGIMCALNIFAGLDGTYTFAGVLWTLSVPVVFATTTVADKYFLDNQGMDSDVFQTILWLGGSIFTLVFLVSPVDAVQNIAEVTSAHPISWLHLLGFCLFPQILTYVFMMASLNRTDPASFGIGHASDPIVATILGAIVFSQILLPIQYFGIVLVIIAVAWMEYREGKEESLADNASNV